MKRKHEADAFPASVSSIASKKPCLTSAPNITTEIHSPFRANLFKSQTLTSYRSAYQESQPYFHGVIHTPISDPLLRSVRSEILTHISFTRKETDIYKIQQSGDLANLDGLDPAQRAHLPSLVELRDALYCAELRAFLEGVTGVGKLSGKKTDMAINIYTPGSYLLCHDDVIGSRRVSYILYLTDPDEPWQAEWGGGLRLYATETKTNGRGEKIKVPLPEHVKVIPPSWGQLSFFAVQPGKSFHDVEEVYPPPRGRPDEDGKRVRMAISGWYHIPQEGEDGYEEGLEQTLSEKSSLSQLQGKEADEFDEPRSQFMRFDEMNQKKNPLEEDPSRSVVLAAPAAPAASEDPSVLTEADLDLLLQYISPSYLTPEMTDRLASSFEENSFFQLDRFLCDSFAKPLREFVLDHDKIDPSNDDAERRNSLGWKTARPPHKHRFLFRQASPESYGRPAAGDLPITSLTAHLFPSPAFRKWLSIVTRLKIEGDASFDCLARRFRRGKDYALASAYEGEYPRLEFCLGCTVSSGWESGDEVDQGDDGGSGGDEVDQGDDGDSECDEVDGNGKLDNNKMVNGTGREDKYAEFGGEEVYMAGDDDDEEDSSSAFNARTQNRNSKSDPAIYKSPTVNDDGKEDDDAILFTDTPAWNRFSIVLRDRGTLRFVKYVGKGAEGDRWDVKGSVNLGRGAWDEDGHGEEAGADDMEEERGIGEEPGADGDEFEGFDDEEEEEEDVG